MEKNKNSHIVSLILIVVIVLLGCYIVYDKFIGEKNTNINPQECNDICKVVEVDYNSFDVSIDVPLVCTIDMTDLEEVNIGERCGEDFDIKNKSYQIRVNNIGYNNSDFSFTYILEKNTFVPSEDDSGIVKYYIGSTMIDAHDGNLRDIFNSLKMYGNNLHIVESTRSDAPKYEYDIDISKYIK